jgi:hypothetical protein
MALMAVLNEGNGDFRSKPRWSAMRTGDGTRPWSDRKLPIRPVVQSIGCDPASGQFPIAAGSGPPQQGYQQIRSGTHASITRPGENLPSSCRTLSSTLDTIVLSNLSGSRSLRR